MTNAPASSFWFGHSGFRLFTGGVTLPGMLRRIGRTSRVLLFLLGVALLVWIPASFVFVVRLQLPSPAGHAGFHSVDGDMVLWHVTPSSRSPWVGVQARGWWDSYSGDLFAHRQRERALWPHAWKVPLSTTRVVHIIIPLWLLAAVCLAWPVTSFIVARRRRRGRGFEVGTELRDQKSEVSPASESTEGALK